MKPLIRFTAVAFACAISVSAFAQGSAPAATTKREFQSCKARDGEVMKTMRAGKEVALTYKSANELPDSWNLPECGGKRATWGDTEKPQKFDCKIEATGLATGRHYSAMEERDQPWRYADCNQRPANPCGDPAPKPVATCGARPAPAPRSAVQCQQPCADNAAVLATLLRDNLELRARLSGGVVITQHRETLVGSPPPLKPAHEVWRLISDGSAQLKSSPPRPDDNLKPRIIRFTVIAAAEAFSGMSGDVVVIPAQPGETKAAWDSRVSAKYIVGF